MTRLTMPPRATFTRLARGATLGRAGDAAQQRRVLETTLALPKAGLHAPGVKPQVGELYQADISVPPQLYAEPALGLRVAALFARDEILRLR